jgi:hypothetical protein
VVALAAAQVAPQGAPGPKTALASASTPAKPASAASGSSDSSLTSDTPAAHLAVPAALAAPVASASASADHDSAAAGSDTAASNSAAQSDPKADANTQVFTPAGPQASAGASSGAPVQGAHATPIPDQIAAQLAARLPGAASSRFDITLDPAGLGHVNVSVQINAAGQVTAALTFDNPHAAAEARSGAGALQHALEQAGFSVGQGGLSFDVGGQGANLARQDARPQTAAAAFAAQVETPIPPVHALAAIYGASGAATGVDIRI